MRILIITYWKETNPGTFLQAYGVQYALRQRFKNAEIKYLNYVGAIKETDSTKMKLKELNLLLTISLFGKKLFMYWHLKSVQNFSSKAKRKICSGMKGGFLCI